MSTVEFNYGIGLGIDAGGTFTDVAVYRFGDDAIIATSKALTTKWNYTEGINAALDTIPAEHLRTIDLVSVSTTLATNALVERQGQKVGVLLMPPYGRFQERELRHTPVAVIQGYMDMTGKILEPVDPAQVEAVAHAMVRDHGVAAFAVSGVGATINASQELEVMDVLRRTTSLSVTCGHQLSGKLGMYERAITAIFNAQVIPHIEKFLDQLRALLRERSIDAPVMIVKGDGTLISLEMAKERPVETVFCGPAASVAGARKLTGLSDALVVDIGGTTTDIAAIRNGRVETCARGNIVAGLRTHVQALNMRTKGLGGDSAINVRHQEIHIGPARVTPVAFAALNTHQRVCGCHEALDYIERDLDPYRMDTFALRLLVFNQHREEVALEPVELEILDALRQRPYCVQELAQSLNLPYGGSGSYSRLLSHNMISVSALTPTDVLHAEGRIALWDAQAAERMCAVYADILGISYEEFAKRVLNVFTRELAVEMFEKLMDNDLDAPVIATSSVCRAVLGKWLDPPDGDLAIRMTLPYPVIGVGAPAGEFLPEAVRLFNTSLVLPNHYEVANAVGAITSTVSISKSIRIVRKFDGRFAIEGLADSHEFDKLDTAIQSAREQLTAEIQKLAKKSWVFHPRIEISTQEETIRNGYGQNVYMGTVLTAHVTAMPEA